MTGVEATAEQKWKGKHVRIPHFPGVQGSGTESGSGNWEPRTGRAAKASLAMLSACRTGASVSCVFPGVISRVWGFVSVLEHKHCIFRRPGMQDI